MEKLYKLLKSWMEEPIEKEVIKEEFRGEGAKSTKSE
jgi:hypothetical protein